MSDGVLLHSRAVEVQALIHGARGIKAILKHNCVERARERLQLFGGGSGEERAAVINLQKRARARSALSIRSIASLQALRGPTGRVSAAYYLETSLGATSSRKLYPAKIIRTFVSLSS